MAERKDVVPTAETVQLSDPTCLDTDVLVQMAEGKLSTERADAVLVHVDRCAQCAALVAGLGPQDPAAVRRVGRYEIIGKLGAGGMGIVYRAFDPELQRHVAIKLVRPERANDDAARTRILREARALARINHPNVVGVYDVGEHAGEVFIATELVDGQTLAEWQLGRDMPTLVDAWVQICRGLAAAHAEGVVHRDVKPANVFVGRDGRVRIGDFGIAHARSDAPLSDDDRIALGTSPPTATASVIAGTPAYMAPEQQAGKVDPRSDQFSACVALVEALTKVRPQADAAITVEPPALAAVLTRGLRANPEQRYPQIRDLADALAGLIDVAPAAASRARWKLAVAGVLAFGAVSGGVITINYLLRDPPPSPPAAAPPPLVTGPLANLDTPQDLSRCAFANLALPEQTTVIAAAGYSGRALGWQFDRSGNDATQIDVAVVTPGPVALVLSAYDPTIWNLRWIESTQIVAVVATGYHRQAIAGLPPTVPVLISADSENPPCGYSENDKGHVETIANQAFGKRLAATYRFEEDTAEITLGPATQAKLVSSSAVTVESFRDPKAPLAGRAALDKLVERGVLRRATDADSPDFARALGSTGEQLVEIDGAFVVLGAFELPTGLTGAHAAIFLVPRGKPRPTGDPGHCTVIDLNQARP